MKVAGIFTSILVLFIWSATVYGIVVDETMVLALSFDEGSGGTAKDSSQYRFDGKIDGADWVDGKYGKALEFDGAAGDVVIVADDPELLLLDGGTLMAWSYIMTESGHVDWPRVMIKSIDNGGTSNGYDLIFDRAGGYSTRFCVGGLCTSYAPVETEVWHHVAVTFDGSTILVYTDGELVGESAQAGPVVDSSGYDLHIGSGAAFDRPYHGIHDEIRIWNRALEEEEIQEQMALDTPTMMSVDPLSKLATTWAWIKDRE